MLAVLSEYATCMKSVSTMSLSSASHLKPPAERGDRYSSTVTPELSGCH